MLRQAIRADRDPCADVASEVAQAKRNALQDLGLSQAGTHMGNGSVEQHGCRDRQKEERDRQRETYNLTVQKHAKASSGDASAIFEALTDHTYDMKAMASVLGLNTFSPDTCTLFEHLQQFFYSAMKALMEDVTKPDQVTAAMKKFSLEVVSDRWTAMACRRVAQCFGLPKDGHVAHTLHQGRVRFFFAGPNAQLRVEVVEDSESAWDMASHRCGVWLLAHSSLGKDNALAIVQEITNHLIEAMGPLPCFNTLDVGHLTYAGLLETLDDGASPDGKHHWLSWMNSEIKQCLGTGHNDIQEKDFCQLAEGVPIGKRATTSDEAACRVK